MKAWWAYWLTLGIGTAVWIGVLVVGGRDGLESALNQPLGATVLLGPIVLAGVNLVVFRSDHEAACRLEVERHPWLSYLVGQGYSARTFAVTGLALLSLAVVVVAALLRGSG